jgi:hypothetical protein
MKIVWFSSVRIVITTRTGSRSKRSIPGRVFISTAKRPDRLWGTGLGLLGGEVARA